MTESVNVMWWTRANVKTAGELVKALPLTVNAKESDLNKVTIGKSELLEGGSPTT